MKKLRVPKQACSTCPYRRDTPPGIWSADEYEKLRVFDEAPPPVPEGLAVFHCHQQNATRVETVCRGWLSVHRRSVAVRLAVAYGLIEPGEVPREAEDLYYASSNAAAEAGLVGVDDPGPEARALIQRLLQKGVGGIGDFAFGDEDGA